MDNFTFSAFADEMEKIAISETFFLRSAMNTLHKTPSLKVPEQLARATLLAKQKGFEDAAWRLGEVFKEWKKGKHPSAAPEGMLRAAKRLGGGRKSYTAPNKGPVVERVNKLHTPSSRTPPAASHAAPKTESTSRQAPASEPSSSSPTSKPKSSWKKKALMYGLPPAALAAGAYGVHRHNEKQFKKHLGS